MAQNLVGKGSLLGKGIERADDIARGLLDKTKIIGGAAKKADSFMRRMSGSQEQSVVDKILNAISYKLKIGVDYEITPRIVGAVGIAMGGQLGGLKAKQIPDAILELGIRYNF